MRYRQRAEPGNSPTQAPRTICSILVHCVMLGLLLALWILPAAQAQTTADLPPIVFVARSHLASKDYIFTKELGPPGQLTTGIDKFAPGSKLLLRQPDGAVRVLLDTAEPAGSPLNPLGLRDVASPDVSFDARRIVCATSNVPGDSADASGSKPA